MINSRELSESEGEGCKHCLSRERSTTHSVYTLCTIAHNGDARLDRTK